MVVREDKGRRRDVKMNVCGWKWAMVESRLGNMSATVHLQHSLPDSGCMGEAFAPTASAQAEKMWENAAE